MTDNSVPEKYEGKSAAELIEMLKSQESFIGEQGRELGNLRRALGELQRSQAPREETGTPKDRFIPKAVADEAILRPEIGLRKVADIAKEEAIQEAERRIEAKMANQVAIERYIAANPVLEKWRDVFSIAGTHIWNANPELRDNLPALLEATKKATLQWVASKGFKVEKDTDRDRVRAGVTTSGGMAGGDRDTSSGEPEDRDTTRPATTGDDQKDAILAAMQELKDFRSKRMHLSRGR